MAGDQRALPFDVEALDSLLTNAGDVLTVLNDEGETIYVSPSIMESLGYDPEEQVGESAFDLVHPDDQEKARHLFKRAQDHPGKTISARIRVQDKEGRWRTFEVRGRRSRSDETLQVMVQIFRDVATREAKKRRLEFQALHDSLTGLPNRRLFEDRLSQALPRAERMGTVCGVLYMDLNGFKQVNDTHGHQAGDRVLQQLVRRLQRVLRAEDTVARLGGDEFLVLLERIESPDQVEHVAERVIDAVESPFELRESTVTMTVAVGAAMSTGTQDATHLIRIADEAMYEAKKQKPESAYRLREQTEVG